MKKLKILQLASFSGNIGDNANITGTRRLLSKNLGYELEFENLEIRQFFWGERKFDIEFSHYVNQFDLFIVGGGNFFELWVNQSCNNTSIDIDITILERIKTPTVFYSLGMDPGMGTSEKGINKFKKWLDYVISQERFLLSLRNDGSLETAISYLGEEYASHFYKVPDGGFFTQVDTSHHIEIPKTSPVIGLNLAGDMLDVRFPNITSENISYKKFLDTFSELFNRLLDEHNNMHLVIFPHIYKDLNITYQFISRLKDKFARNRITVSPYLHGFEAQDYIFGSYTQCDLIIGNRFHSNVCAIGQKIPSIGLINYRQIEKFYSELRLSDRAIAINVCGYENLLYNKILDSLDNSNKIIDKYTKIYKSLELEINNFHRYLNNWINLFI
ncbi:MAG: polysaccharide pyruvyl transferase family protein [Saprospiraceae bacterium]|nr:polysaccharide pyruvyl transferase family protein [Saprospiraceae bacterium]